MGLTALKQIQIEEIPLPPLPSTYKETGTTWVQVLRSAPVTMLKDEKRAHGGPEPVMAQDNCMKAMLTAISGAQKFIYIEGQFFQSECGIDLPADAPLSGAMAALTDLKASPGYKKYAALLEIKDVPPEKILSKLRWAKVDDVRRDAKGEGADFINDMFRVLNSHATIRTSSVMGKNQKSLLNPVGEALAKKIERKIFDGLPFHVYMVLPVHPEGRLDTLNIMNQVHLTMQSLVFGSDSLVNRISRAILVGDLIKEKKKTLQEARAEIGLLSVEKLNNLASDRWKQYLTLLNLRNWTVLEGRPVTEQIYVHSKLLIADDRVAIIGSANINDRGQLGDRDSELAVTVWGEDEVPRKLDGITVDAVSDKVHYLRIQLWEKIFGLAGGSSPAKGLKSVIDKPAASATWKAIQAVAQANAVAYHAAFPFLPSATGKPSSLWPTWNKEKHCLNHHMPFDERFWRDDDIQDESCTWDAKSRAKESAPKGVQGFIVALPITWTKGESNVSGMNNYLMANNNESEPGMNPNSPGSVTEQRAFASLAPTAPETIT